MNFIRFLLSKVFYWQVFFAIILLFFMIIGLHYWLSFATHHNEKIKVPNLFKIPIGEAKIILKNLDLNYKVIDSSAYNSEYPKKSITKQIPKAGNFVKRKRKIYLTLNPNDYEKIKLPSFYGKTKKEMTVQLKILGFEIGKTYYIYDLGKNVVRKLKHKGKVLKQGMLLKKHDTIDLVVGNGKAY